MTPHWNRRVETVLKRVTIYIFIESQETLSLNYRCYPFLFGVLDHSKNETGVHDMAVGEGGDVKW